MVTTSRQRPLFIIEHMAERGLIDETLGEKIGQSRTTVWRWRTEQHRLNPQKIALIAKGLNVSPEDLWRPPGRPSLDAIVKDATDDLHATAADIVSRLMNRPNE